MADIRHGMAHAGLALGVVAEHAAALAVHEVGRFAFAPGQGPLEILFPQRAVLNHGLDLFRVQRFMHVLAVRRLVVGQRLYPARGQIRQRLSEHCRQRLAVARFRIRYTIA